VVKVCVLNPPASVTVPPLNITFGLVGVGVGVAVPVLVGVIVCVGVIDGVGVFVGVSVFVGVGDGVGKIISSHLIPTGIDVLKLVAADCIKISWFGLSFGL
jgi:hypothetical protein